MRKLIPLTLSLSPVGRGWGEGRFGHLALDVGICLEFVIWNFLRGVYGKDCSPFQ